MDAKVVQLDDCRKVKGFWKYLKRYRRKQGLTQDQLGARIGYDRSVISRWETSSLPVRPKEAAVLASAMGEPGLLAKYCAECPVSAAYNELFGPNSAA